MASPAPGLTVRLTELPGRELLRRRGDALLRDGRQISIIFIDLDGFKSVNDILGHLAGDRCLQNVAVAVSCAMGADATLYHYGGDEFVVLLEAGLPGDAGERAEAIRKSIAAVNAGGRLKVTGSIGVVCARPCKAETVSGLLRAADEAAYASKINGKDRVTMCPLSDELRQAVHERRAEEPSRAGTGRCCCRPGKWPRLSGSSAFTWKRCSTCGSEQNTRNSSPLRTTRWRHLSRPFLRRRLQLNCSEPRNVSARSCGTYRPMKTGRIRAMRPATMSPE